MKPPSFLLKSIATLLGGAVLTLGVYTPVSAPRAHAQLATFDFATFVTSAAQTIIMQVLDGIAWAVAKTAIQSMTKSIVNWINSGYQGEPAFSQNLKRDMRQVEDGVAGLFLTSVSKQIGALAIQSPFAADMARLTVGAYYLATSDDDLLAQRLKYTLLGYSQYSVNYMRGNLPPRGLQDWHSMIFECGNDPVCASFTTQEHLVNLIDAEAASFLADFNNGRGFLSWKGECTDTAGSAAGNEAFQQCVAQNEAGGEQQDCFLVNESVGTSLKDADTCVAHDVLTPGSVVESALVEQFGSPLRQLELADSINEIVGAVVTQMVGQILGGGGLARASSPASGGRGRPVNNATAPGTTGATIGAGFESVVASERDRTLAFRTSWTEIRDMALRARDACPVSGFVGVSREGEIQNAIDRADAAIARANTAITELEKVLSLVELGNEPELSSGAEQVGNSQRAYQAYQDLLAGNKLLTAEEQTTAAMQRSEMAGSNSLYLKMRGFEEQCT